MPKSRPWSANWIQGELLTKDTGQSLTYYARRVGDDEASWNYVLKILKKNEPGRRRRMVAEYSILRGCDHPGIVKAFESNAEDEAAKEVFTIVEYIPGETLANVIGRSVLPLESAIAMTRTLLGAVDHYTTVAGNCLHRDIKPDNIMARDANPLTPVLIDFGLGYNPILEAGLSTDPGERLGNGFIGMPEFQPGNSRLRSVVSDLTQCTGILFYAITGIFPGMLKDEVEAKPHQRPANRDALKRATGERYERLSALFDKGFNWSPERRYLSVQVLDEALAAITSPQATRVPMNERLSRIQSTIASTPQFEEHRMATHAVAHFHQVMQKTLNDAKFNTSLVSHVVMHGLKGHQDDATVPNCTRTLTFGRTDSKVLFGLEFSLRREDDTLHLKATFRRTGEVRNSVFGDPSREQILSQGTDQVALSSGATNQKIQEFIEDRFGAALEWLLQQPVETGA